MKKVLIAVMMTLSSMALVLPEADARRMGGGGSFGKQYSRPAPSQPSQQQGMQQAQPGQSTSAARQPNAGASGAAQQRPSMMRNILGGALLGLGLGALLSSLGIGGALASIIGTVLTFLLIGAVVVFLYRMFARKNGAHNGMQPAYVSSYAKTVTTPEIGSGMHHGTRPDAFHGGVGGAATSLSDIPADFDEAGFLRNAKTYFIRLQAAWDRGDVNDIREFTTPEMFAELRMQLQERGDAVNHTDVLSVEAEMLGIETLENDYLASVKFFGTIREEDNAAAESFTEIWNLTKPVSGNGGWTLAGIQQVS